MTRLRTNIIANFAGQASTVLIQLAIIPVYIHWLGIEAYALIGFQITLQALMQALDFGLSPSVNRELARYSAFPDQGDKARDFIRTLEIGYWLLGVMIGLAIYAAAPFLSVHWLQQSAMPGQVIRRAIEIMALLIAVQWPQTFYYGGLTGLERHSTLNAIKVSMAVLAAAGGYVVVTRISSTIIALLWWQCAVGLVHVGLTTAALWKFLPRSSRPARVRRDAVRTIGGFAGGMTIITVTTLVLTQLDKVVLSRMLSLEQFGYYVLAGTVSNGLSFLVLPLFTSIFPRFSALVAAEDRATLERLYRRAWGLAMALIVPCSLVLALFPSEILLLWTRDQVVAQSAGRLVALLTVGSALNGLMAVPYAVQIAAGWTSLSVKVNLILTVVAVPAIIFAADQYGSIGAAAVWPLLMASYVAVALPLIHRRLLPDVGTPWLIGQIILPIALTISAIGLLRAVVRTPHDLAGLVVEITVALVAAELTLVSTTSSLRRELFWYWSKVFAQHNALHRTGE